LPLGAGKHWLNSTGSMTSKLAGGWQINGISTFLSGFPFTPLVGSNRSGDGDTRNPDRPNLVQGFTGPIVTGNPAKWFNPAAFAVPQAGTYGTLGRNSFNGPGLADVDFSILKNTPISERVSLQFRAEAFNLFNRVNFGPPNTTVFSVPNGNPAVLNPAAPVNPSGGFISTLATNPRQIQFGLKLLF
jgi:hypothetical protein